MVSFKSTTFSTCNKIGRNFLTNSFLDKNKGSLLNKYKNASTHVFEHSKKLNRYGKIKSNESAVNKID